MQTKLTLRLDDSLIRRAKKMANRRGKSVSQMVSDYFSSLEGSKASPELSPLTQSMLGSLKEKKVSEQDYMSYLEKKHS
jgi:hypothetical protein